MARRKSTRRVLKKASECFEGLSMNGKSSMKSNPPVRPEPRRRTPIGAFQLPASLLLILVMLYGCASQFQPLSTAEKVSDKEAEQQPKTPMPTITYRPGG